MIYTELMIKELMVEELMVEELMVEKLMVEELMVEELIVEEFMIHLAGAHIGSELHERGGPQPADVEGGGPRALCRHGRCVPKELMIEELMVLE